MGSINRSHNEADGGILLFSGELILLYCDSVSCEVGGKESFKGRVYLTTHRLVIIIAPYRQNAPVKSFCAPFCAISRCSVEQPIFGANYIEATVRDEADPSKSFSFKLKFSKGGAIELAMAMNRAVNAVGRNFNPSMPPPPAYTPSPSAQYYQAPPTVYAPGYNCGVQMPVQQFPDQPPIGFIYTSEAPPPYPGLGGQGQGQGQNPYGQQPSSGYPPAAGANYPGQYPPSQAPPAGAYPQGQQQPPGYPTSQPQQQSGGYPGQQTWGGYPQPPNQQPQQPAGYPQPNQHYPQPSGGGYPQAPAQPPASAGYPDLSQAGQGQSQPTAWPSAPAANPNWPDDKKSN